LSTADIIDSNVKKLFGPLQYILNLIFSSADDPGTSNKEYFLISIFLKKLEEAAS
jgi:hypothetical protein